MSMTDDAGQALSSEQQHPRRRAARFTAAALTVGVAVAAMVTSGGGAAGAATPISQSEGRFLTGTAAGQSFDSVAALNGETAKYPGNPGPNQNNLSGSVLGQALASPLGNISVPFPGGVTFGAVGQFAQANKDGSASASSGLIGSNGAINVGGSGNGDLATIDLANLPGASSLTSLLGDLRLTVGAVTGHAQQAAFGKTLADPSAGCTGGTYKRVSASNQAGSYQFANLTLAATSPVLATLGTTLTSTLGTLITRFNSAAGSIPGGLVTISGLPTAADLTQDFSVSLAGGGVTASLADGSVTIDLAKILKSDGVDINNLCPNTSLLPYLTDALSGLPAAIDALVNGLVDKLNTSLGTVVIKVAGVPLTLTQLTDLITPVTGALTTNLGLVVTALDTALKPAVAALTTNLLDLTANAQNESGGTFTEAALMLTLIPNGGSLPTLPAPPTIPGLPAAPLSTNLKAAVAKIAAAKPAGKASSSAKPAASASPHSVHAVKLASAVRPLAAPVQAAAAGAPALQLNLGLAAVTNNEPTPATSTPTTAVPGTAIPTGVPAGAAAHHDNGSPLTPIALLVVGLVLAAGTTVAVRTRGRFSR